MTILYISFVKSKLMLMYWETCSKKLLKVCYENNRCVI